jgi:hypothetical protein
MIENNESRDQNHQSEWASPVPARRSRLRKGAWIGVVLLALLAVAGIFRLVAWDLRNKTQPATAPRAQLDPRRSYEGPYRNIHPDVHYVGDASCLTCHPGETASFHEHPMGRSLLPIAQVAPQQVYDSAHNNPFAALGSQFVVERQGQRVVHRQKRQDAAANLLAEHTMEVHYAIGSGRGGYSYLTDRDGYLFQAPISWFAQKQIWDLSPGFDDAAVVGRPVEAECLFCHANRVRPRPGYKNRYEEPIFDGSVIGCERCHGPGERHIQTAEKLDIVNPKNLTSQLHDAVCEQCHLTAVRVLPYGRELFDFRPGLPLADFFSVFVYAAKADEERPAVTHVEQMHESRCYQGTSDNEKLKCASCHSPHHYIGRAHRVAHYRASCLACHEHQGCALPRAVRLQTSKEDSCIDCHMPRKSAADVPHTAATDHRILRRADSKPGQQERGFASGSDWLLTPFGGRRVERGNRQAERDLGMALVMASGRNLLPRGRATAQARILLEHGLEDDDLEAWEAKGWTLLLQNNGPAARAAFDKVLALQPQHEGALAGAAEAANYTKQIDDSVGYWRRAVAVNPWSPIYRRQFALLLMRKQLWDEVRSQCQAWMRLDPFSAEARMLWVTCLARAGDKDKARQEFARIEALHPPNLEQLRSLYVQQMR